MKIKFRRESSVEKDYQKPRKTVVVKNICRENDPNIHRHNNDDDAQELYKEKGFCKLNFRVPFTPLRLGNGANLCSIFIKAT